jgi:hypothetical protein
MIKKWGQGVALPMATFFSFSVASAHSAPLKCKDWNEDTPNQVAVARIATTQPRLHFIAGPDHPLAHLGSAGLPWAINGRHLAGDAFAVLGVGAQAIAGADQGHGVGEVVVRRHGFWYSFRDCNGTDDDRDNPVSKRFSRIHPSR